MWAHLQFVQLIVQIQMSSQTLPLLTYKQVRGDEMQQHCASMA
uniref:Uncharacterized protein n=1 Tax=Arundo donax TaxID=35708 RepID=A0A0A9DUY6_ARUDO